MQQLVRKLKKFIKRWYNIFSFDLMQFRKRLKRQFALAPTTFSLYAWLCLGCICIESIWYDYIKLNRGSPDVETHLTTIITIIFMTLFYFLLIIYIYVKNKKKTTVTRNLFISCVLLSLICACLELMIGNLLINAHISRVVVLFFINCLYLIVMIYLYIRYYKN